LGEQTLLQQKAETEDKYRQSFHSIKTIIDDYERDDIPSDLILNDATSLAPSSQNMYK
jgi:hypothetical protein